MTTDQKLNALLRVLELVFNYVGGWLPSNVQGEIRRTFAAIKASDKTTTNGGNLK